jgi:hypothetical protein
LDEKVVTLEGVVDDHLLDGEGVLDRTGLEGVDDRTGNAEIGKGSDEFSPAT